MYAKVSPSRSSWQACQYWYGMRLRSGCSDCYLRLTFAMIWWNFWSFKDVHWNFLVVRAFLRSTEAVLCSPRCSSFAYRSRCMAATRFTHSPSGSYRPGIGFGVGAQRCCVRAQRLAPSASRHLSSAVIDCRSGVVSSTRFNGLPNVDFPSDVTRGDTKSLV